MLKPVKLLKPNQTGLNRLKPLKPAQTAQTAQAAQPLKPLKPAYTEPLLSWNRTETERTVLKPFFLELTHP